MKSTLPRDFWMSLARLSQTWSKAKPPRRSGKHLISRTISHRQKKNKSERRTSGAKKSRLWKSPGNLPEISRKSPGNQMSSSTSLENYQKLHNYSNTKLKGQIISKCPYAIIVYPKLATKKISEISALASKERSNQKNKGTLLH